jgi:galactokinase
MQRVRVRAPGRVNLIGDHTDYNDGFVLPVAIHRETIVDAVARDDRSVVLRSASVEGERTFNLDSLDPAPQGDWSDYVRGMAIELQNRGVELHGAELQITSSIPIGAGLSSSAALEISSGRALLALAGVEVDPVTLALTAQRAENEHTGTRCGIMDQLVSTSAAKGHALLIDTRSLQLTPVAVPAEAAIVACNTMVRRSLANESAYNERRAECERAAQLLGVAALRDATMDAVDAARSTLGDVLYRRAKHVVTENARVLEGARVLAQSDGRAFGELMYESHASLRDDFGVSCKQLDIMVEEAQKFEGALGARMTGGGFGGCTVNLIARGRVEAFLRYMTERYHDRTGVFPEIYFIDSAPGATIEEA